MGVFRFRLAPVLRQRERAEQTEQRAVAAIERERLELENELREQNTAIERELDALRQVGSGGSTTAEALRRQSTAVVAARQRAHTTAVRLAGVLERLSRARSTLAEASTARRSMELLRDRRYAEHVEREERIEQRALDDLASRPGEPSGPASTNDAMGAA
ncbi:MAG: flagellar FliJ family protein [Planctomycetota bacterium]